MKTIQLMSVGEENRKQPRIDNILNAKPWTEVEEKIIELNYSRLGKKICELLPDRSWEAIKGRVKRLNVTWNNRPRTLYLTDLERAYIAGLVDGEGFISFINDHRRVVRPVLGIASTSLKLMDWLEDKFYDLSAYKTVKPATQTQKVCYYYRLDGATSVHALLEQIVPYMIIKKDRAELMLSYTVTRVGSARRLDYTVDPKPIAEKIWELNKKGPDATVIVPDKEVL